MNSQDGQEIQIEKKTLELKELAVTESLSIVEMSQVHGGTVTAPAGGGGRFDAPAAPSVPAKDALHAIAGCAA
jgi:hypothetical protein